jgi:hypothetical protein
MNKLKLYITFPDTLANSNEEMYTRLLALGERLSAILKRLLGHDIGIYTKGKDFAEENKADLLKRSGHVLFFMHPSFSEDAGYLRELDDATEHLNLIRIDNIKGFDKMYKVCLSPLKEAMQSGLLEKLYSYDFYERNTFTRKIRSLDIEDRENATAIYSKLLDLAYDIKVSVNGRDELFSVENESEKTVYLGLSSFDQKIAREDIRRELQHYGYRVLPAINMPENGEQFREVLLENLSHSNTVIQLMGANYGDLLKGTKYSMPDYQNLVIREFQQQADSLRFKRYIWLPQHLKINDQRQALYLKRLRRDEADINTEIIESPLEAFKTILASRLTVGKHKADRLDLGNLSRVYLLSEEHPGHEYQQLYNSLTLSGLKVITLDYSEQTGIYARHLQALKDSDGIIIFQQHSNPYWLNSKLRDVIKAPGIGRTQPFKKVIISSSLEPDKNLVRMIRSNIEILKMNGSTPELILQKLTSE